MRICIDPGHGGRDSGAIGPGGHFEKTVVMSIAEKMYKYLRQYALRYTRSADVFVSLRERVRIARNYQTDLPTEMFVSLHCNGAANPDANGTEVFFWHTNRRSERLARLIQTAIIDGMSWRDRGIKPNNRFAVLRGISPVLIPAVLVEYNFISNPTFERFLIDPGVQEDLAKLTSEAIKQYIEEVNR